MNGGFAAYILTAFCLMFVIEGMIYALFPDGVRRMMALALTQPVARLRLFGLVIAISGVSLIWLIRALLV